MDAVAMWANSRFARFAPPIAANLAVSISRDDASAEATTEGSDVSVDGRGARPAVSPAPTLASLPIDSVEPGGQGGVIDLEDSSSDGCRSEAESIVWMDGAAAFRGSRGSHRSPGTNLVIELE